MKTKNVMIAALVVASMLFTAKNIENGSLSQVAARTPVTAPALYEAFAAPVAARPLTQEDESATAKVIVEAPDKVKVGELVVIDCSKSEADDFSWEVVPATKNFMVIDDGKRAVFSHGASGEFMFIIGISHKGKVHVKTHTIKVVGGVTPSDGLATKIQSWCDKVQSPTKRDDALRLAQSFSSVSVILDDADGPLEIVQATKRSNENALGTKIGAWEPFFLDLRDELKRRASEGKLNDAESHRKLWLEISDGLESYADTLEE